MNLCEMSCPALPQSRVPCNHSANYFHPFNNPTYPYLAAAVCFSSVHQKSISTFRHVGGKIGSDLITCLFEGGFSCEYPVKMLLSGFPSQFLLL